MRVILRVLSFCALLLCSLSMSAAEGGKTVTLLFTNDFESAYDPTPAFWREDMQRIGGIAQLATLIENIRAQHSNVFLFDAGDIFTGTLAKLTRGELSFELMLSMGYDAMVIGNHEFEYGWEELARQKHRVPFPVLGANLFYRGTTHAFAQPYTVLERRGVRIGVIGILGQDAATALVPSHIAGLDVLEPAAVVRRYVELLRPNVDLVVVLTHQGYTAPMQTDDEADPTVQRGNAENIALAGAVPGIDVILAGHTDAGTRTPLVHPETGTLIMQTFGQGQHLGFLQLHLPDSQPGTGAAKPRLLDGRLIAVDSDALAPQAVVAGKLERYRRAYPEIYASVGRTAGPIVRRYYLESDLGNLFADILRQHTAADVALMPSGALRKDLPAGVIRKVDLLDAFPFQDRVARVTLSGEVLLQIIEQGLSLERGLLQVSGLMVTYDPRAPIGERVVSAAVNGRAIERDHSYQVATLEILAQGGDAYVQFHRAADIEFEETAFASVLEQYFANTGTVSIPARGRLRARR